MTVEQFRLLLYATPSHYRLLVHTLAATGMRWGEVTALRVSDVELETSRLKVRQAWKETGVSGVYALGSPKTSRSRRDVTVDKGTLKMLKKAIAGRSLDDLVFMEKDAAGSIGAYVNYDKFYRNIWQHRICPALTTESFPRRPRIHD